MTLRATKPKTICNRFKASIFGAPGAGKSFFAYGFPRPYIIDTEGLMKYSQFVKMIEENQGVVVDSLKTLDSISVEIRALMTEAHDYKTLIIDSISTPYATALKEESKRVGTAFHVHRTVPNQTLTTIADLLTDLDMNVILIAHSKTRYEDGKSVGERPDVPDKFEYMMGTVIQVRLTPKRRIGHVLKSRYTEMETLSSFELSYTAIKKMFGGEMFERNVVCVDLPSSAQLAQFEACSRGNTPLKNQWLKAANITDFSQMKKSDLEKCIAYFSKNKQKSALVQSGRNP